MNCFHVLKCDKKKLKQKIEKAAKRGVKKSETCKCAMLSN